MEKKKGDTPRGTEGVDDEVAPDSAVTVFVNSLKYLTRPMVASLRENEFLKSLPQGPLVKRMKKIMDSNVSKDLKDVSFRALPGQLTAILSMEQAERRSVIYFQNSKFPCSTGIADFVIIELLSS